MPNERFNTTQPTDWKAAWEKAAAEAGMSLAEWIGEQCNRALPREVRKTLSERAGRGRPKNDDDNTQ